MAFVEALKKEMEGPVPNVSIGVIKLVKQNKDLLSIGNLTPGKASVVVTSVMVNKAMIAAGMGSESQAIKCVGSVTSLAGTIAIAAIMTPTGFGAALAVASVVMDSYSVGKNCFVETGVVSHAMKIIFH